MFLLSFAAVLAQLAAQHWLALACASTALVLAVWQ